MVIFSVASVRLYVWNVLGSDIRHTNSIFVTQVHPSKIALRLKKVCYEVSVFENCQRRSCKAFIGLTICAKMRNHPSIFARSTAAVTPSEKSSTNTNRKCTTRFPMSPRWKSYVLHDSPKGWLEDAVSEIWTISCENFEMVPHSMSFSINH